MVSIEGALRPEVGRKPASGGLRLLAASRGAVAGCLGTFGQWLRVGSRRCCTFGIETDVHPIFTPQLDGMLGAIGTIPAAHIVGGAKLIASPADSFRVPRTERILPYHRAKPLSPTAAALRLPDAREYGLSAARGCSHAHR